MIVRKCTQSLLYLSRILYEIGFVADRGKLTKATSDVSPTAVPYMSVHLSASISECLRVGWPLLFAPSMNLFCCSPLAPNERIHGRLETAVAAAADRCEPGGHLGPPPLMSGPPMGPRHRSGVLDRRRLPWEGPRPDSLLLREGFPARSLPSPRS